MVKMKNNRSVKKQSIQQILLLLAILICVNLLGRFVFTRFDMTQEKRFTLSPASIQLAKNLEDIVYFKIYLDGDLPPGFTRLKNSLKEMLDEFRIYSGDNIEYEFINPSANPDEKERMQLYRQLAGKGLIPTNLEQKDKSGQSQKIIFPGAIVNYRSKEFPFQVLKSRMGSSPEEMLNNSVENLEYEICSMLRRITTEHGNTVSFLKGQKEISNDHLSDANAALSDFYKVDTVEINGQLNALKDISVLIIAGPDTAFNEKDKFIIDQYIMHGGKVFWLIDKMDINMDSLAVSSTNVAVSNELNIDDMLFKYGVRINPDLLLDLQAAPIPIVTGYVGNQPKQQLFPWYYFPLLQTDNLNPIVHNLNSVKAEFVSSIDTIETENVHKTILLTTGKFSRIQMAPARVSLNILRDEPDPKLFNRHNIPTAVLLEGIFASNYVNRIPEALANSSDVGFKRSSEPTNMIVVSDADIISNYVSKKGNTYMLGYDRFTGQTYGNRNFILNCVDYLCGVKDILSLRGKEFRLRLLDPSKTENPSVIRWINILVPVAIVIIFGIIFNLIRRKRFDK
jgi:ABC-2 type transport system permease protein